MMTWCDKPHHCSVQLFRKVAAALPGMEDTAASKPEDETSKPPTFGFLLYPASACGCVCIR